LGSNPRAKRADEFQRLSVDERFKRISEETARVWQLINSSPDREEILKEIDAEEEEWKRIQKDLFDRFGVDEPLIVAVKTER
jgi:DNA-directed RNA polymerase specialized sigma subunit